MNKEDIASFIHGVPQLVPETWCLKCKVCCRFPDTEGVQTPAWSPLEAVWAKKSGGRESWFKGSPDVPSLRPVLKPCGHGYLCPAFNPETSECRIYAVRPLDCRIYPFVLVKDPAGTRVVLAMDMKCPYLQERGSDPETLAYSAELSRYLQRPEASAYVKMNPEIVGPMWPEFVVVAPMPEMAAALKKEAGAVYPALRLFSPADIPLLEEALLAGKHSHSSYTLAGLLGWSDLIRYWWSSQAGAFCLFAEQAGGFSMPLPPLGRKTDRRLIERVWGILTEANQGAPSVSRVEGIEEAEVKVWTEAGFHLAEGEQEYLYDRFALAGLKGDSYRSQRGAVNRGLKVGAYRWRPFKEGDLLPCLQLYTSWGISRQQETGDFMPRALIRDGLFFHRRLMMDWKIFVLTGRVLESDGKVRGYTFGAPVSKEMFCVFLEIADQAFPGIPQILFQEFCKEMSSYRLINAMGDCGLPGLRKAKEQYHPLKLICTATATK